MKGLLLKDLHITKWTCLSIILITFLFAAVSYVDNQNSTFFILYPLVLASVAVTSTFSYDEKYKLNLFTETLPCSRSKIVSSKYLLSIIIAGTVSVIMICVQVIRVLQDRGCMWSSVLSSIAFVFFIAFFPSALILPFSFKFSSSNAKFIVYFLIGITFGIIGFSSGFSDASFEGEAIHIPDILSIILITATILIFVVSWIISIRIYNKRDL